MRTSDEIRERAYAIWEAEGRPCGKDAHHWLRAERELTRKCTYCFRIKSISEFSYEHIWPDALGGDYLPKQWKTRNVCQRCNNLAGQFVDGEFIKSWFVSNERAIGAVDFLDLSKPELAKLPLQYLGQMTHEDLLDNEVAEYWVGPCGANIVHIRPKYEPLWNTYAGGKPSKKSKDWGSAFLALTTSQHIWILVTVNSFHNHFRRADRVVLNMAAPQGFSPPFDSIDQENIDQARRVKIARSVGEAAEKNEKLELHFAVASDLGSRFLAKLALGLGRELLGDQFLETDYANILKLALWERSAAERRKLPVRGAGYLSEGILIKTAKFLSWTNAWTLTVIDISGSLCLIVATPSGKTMSILISSDAELLKRLNRRFADGEVYITVPVQSYALQSPITLPSMIAHVTDVARVPELSELADKRRDPGCLPPCR